MTDLARIKRRVQNMVGRAVLSAIDDDAGIQALQIEGLADEVQDGVERLGDYGFTSHPLPGAEAAVVYAGGLRSHGLVVAVGDRRYRLRGLKLGEVAMYDDQGQAVHLTRDGILVKSTGKVTIEAPEVLVDSPSVKLGGDGPAVARVGDPVANGKIAAGSTKVKAA